ncbi:bifunctional phosphoribosylaminoimidazolecarboxamide formyltransferase/inosine monophosphate cyclohydrolase [Kyrpidia spormannii]|uniref:Bifunctional purine biosynthesis protein PurH n=1 Tax=Kyrpidia spormannii TaxID=2055160 RepID=A0A2K8N5F3_9BACL|nr:MULTISPECIES: bifunctional phosphoribosylaminoimidazolecarboxamide formyltransferase/IMP cyclohydrolase [Kyrpidia]ATY83800.1 bifunctional phosphoribosylaminoimidazolecarboxamide formyltransferase/inosine monophosphate cyclohydrolase [Kyrpidia spormannii]MCL6575674.1 bifunctional phosphoribosylaminoimidazolecarboxamide formyltransferase/IMP cyclohydrolase [Kyrpidia sp.]
MRRALISVSDKTGIVELGQKLAAAGVEILSTGGTSRVLREAGVAVKDVSDFTGFPEILDGRVKTLHPRVHGGILALRDREEHRRQMEEHGLEPIDAVVVNLYPFRETVSRPGARFEEIVEQIDIGGPSLIRAAAKNHRHVAVVVDPADYDRLAEAAGGGAPLGEGDRLALAAKAFRHTAAYDAVIAGYLSDRAGERFPEQLTLTYDRVQSLRYGENPHQPAAFYREPFAGPSTLAGARQLHGKELSYNNLLDADAALHLVREFQGPTAVAVKHTNPCGVGWGETLADAFHEAYEADPVSIFGGIIAVNRPLDGETARQMKEIFLEIVIAPEFTPEALEILTTKKNLRLLEIPGLLEPVREGVSARTVSGGLLVQGTDVAPVVPDSWRPVTKRIPSGAELEQMALAWRVVKHVKSNAIVLVHGRRTVGVGAGQMNRVGSARIAIAQAGELARGSVMASDAFFPMSDTVEEAAKAGVTAIVQPGGSIRDEESIRAADEAGIAMVFTGMRHFRHG